MNIFDLDSWNEIWETINRNRKRSIMTAFGVFWGIFMLIMLVGLGFGLERSFVSILGDMSTNSAFLMAGRTSVPYKGFSSGRWWQFNQADLDQISRMDGVKHSTGFAWNRSMTFTYGNKNGSYYILGLAPDYNLVNPMDILKGRFINDIDIAQRRKVCVISKNVAEELFGDEDPIGKAILMNNTYMTVIGIYQNRNTDLTFSDPDRTAYIPRSTFQQMMNIDDKMEVILLSGYDKTDMGALTKNIETIIKENHNISPNDGRAMNIWNMAERFRIFNGIFIGVRILTWIVGIGTLLAGIVGISNIMLIVVRERTQEIGVRRALGAKPFAIISQIMAESFVLTFIAGIFGFALAVGALSMIGSAGINMFGGMPFDPQISLGLGMSALGILVLGGLIAGLLPSSRAIAIKPVDAIREE